MVTTRWNVDRLSRKVSRALAVATGGEFQRDLERVAEEVAEDTSDRIAASGRGGSHNSDFANIETRVFRAQSGRYNILVGWLNPPAGAEEKGGGGRLWYQYQDSGFRLFGGDQWINGVGATLDQRERLLSGVEGAMHRHVDSVARALNGG